MNLQNGAGLRVLACSAIAGFMSVLQPLQAQETITDKGPLAAINTCRTIADPNQRVTCYDSAVDSLNSAVAKKDVTIVDKATVKEAKRGLFGFSLGNLRLFGDSEKRTETEDREDNELTTTIKSARMLGDGRWRFIIESGAVWETIETIKGAQDPKPGSEVKLQKAAFGSFFATFGKGLRNRAKRVN